MKHMKLVMVTGVLIFALSLAGCGNSQGEQNADSGTSVNSQSENQAGDTGASDDGGEKPCHGKQDEIIDIDRVQPEKLSSCHRESASRQRARKSASPGKNRCQDQGDNYKSRVCRGGTSWRLKVRSRGKSWVGLGNGHPFPPYCGRVRLCPDFCRFIGDMPGPRVLPFRLQFSRQRTQRPRALSGVVRSAATD